MRLRAGEVLGKKYQILKALGKGGEGSVWLAVHLQTEQLWAVKEVVRKGNGREFHELNMMKKLRHPSLPRVVDVLEDSDCVYLIMEYIRGCTLEEGMRSRGRMSVEQVLDIGFQLSGVLCYLHSRDTPVLHLDLKPANIIQKKNGTLVLVDFGAAWKCTEKTGDGIRCGTEGYAAPEQYDLNSRLDGRTDIYGLGATLYYLVSGVRYSAALRKSKIPGCPERLGDVIRKCIQREPELRYESSRKLHRRLGKLRKRYAFRRQRNRIWAALALALFALGAAMQELSREFSRQAEENWNYEKLLEEIFCMPEEERMEYYLRAVYLEPDREEAYLQFIHQADRDACFTREEETALRTLLHTIPLGQEMTYEELLAGNPSAYGQMTSDLGMVYWYDYEGEDGKRIASGWFAKAVEAGRKMEAENTNGGESRKKEAWFTRAEIFSNMGSYYERLGKQDETGERGGAEGAYWQDLKQLLTLEEMEAENPVTQLRLYGEAMNQIIFLAETLWQQGISREELLETVELILAGVGNMGTADSGSGLELELSQEILSRSETAREIVYHLEDEKSM